MLLHALPSSEKLQMNWVTYQEIVVTFTMTMARTILLALALAAAHASPKAKMSMRTRSRTISEEVKGRVSRYEQHAPLHLLRDLSLIHI